jgi:hypothetical protein
LTEQGAIFRIELKVVYLECMKTCEWFCIYFPTLSHNLPKTTASKVSSDMLKCLSFNKKSLKFQQLEFPKQIGAIWNISEVSKEVRLVAKRLENLLMLLFWANCVRKWGTVIFLHFLKGSCGSRIGKNHRHFSQIGKTRFL